LHDDADIPEELRQQFLQNIISESDRLNRLIDKILDLEKFKASKRSIFLKRNYKNDKKHPTICQSIGTKQEN
jgi:signal transduction histidine kinase